MRSEHIERALVPHIEATPLDRTDNTMTMHYLFRRVTFLVPATEVPGNLAGMAAPICVPDRHIGSKAHAALIDPE